MGGVGAAARWHLNPTGWTPEIPVASRGVITTALTKGARPVDRGCGWWWRLGCRRAGGFNTGWVWCGHASLPSCSGARSGVLSHALAIFWPDPMFPYELVIAVGSKHLLREFT